METQAAQTLIGVVLKPENLAVVIGVWVILTTVKQVIAGIVEKAWWARIEPILPLVLCTAALWVPGAAQAGMSLADKLLLGLLLGFAVGHAHKIISQTGMGKDDRINPPATPAP